MSHLQDFERGRACLSLAGGLGELSEALAGASKACARNKRLYMGKVPAWLILNLSTLDQGLANVARKVAAVAVDVSELGNLLQTVPDERTPQRVPELAQRDIDRSSRPNLDAVAGPDYE